MKPTIFTLTSARSGTVYLRHLFQNNVPDCACRHEPFFDWGNPTLFGPAIYDAFAGRVERVRARLAKKRRYIEHLPSSLYFESSHAFLKSAYLAALEFFPEMRLIHLVRDPLKVAKSEAYRQHWRERMHAPFHFYRGDDGRRHFCWGLTGNEDIFQAFTGEPAELNAPASARGVAPCASPDSSNSSPAPPLNRPQPLSLFQWYFLQWIEIENRAIQFLERHHLQDRCFLLHTPGDLNNPAKVKAMFDFFGLKTRFPEIILRGRKNQSIGVTTVITKQDERECQAVLERIPPRFLEIFQHPPYVRFPWNERLRSARSQNTDLAGALSGKMRSREADVREKEDRRRQPSTF